MLKLLKLFSWQREDGAEFRRLVALINELRAGEGWSVTLMNDNPDFGGPNCAIEVCGDWTNWCTRRFSGHTLEAALRAAVSEKRRIAK